VDLSLRRAVKNVKLPTSRSVVGRDVNLKTSEIMMYRAVFLWDPNVTMQYQHRSLVFYSESVAADFRDVI